MRRAASLVLGIMVALAAQPGTAGAQGAADAEAQRLADRAKTDRGEALRQDVLAFLRKHPGTAAAVKAGVILHDIPSPLDKLDANAISQLERFAWHPKETVAVLGEHRGRQAGALTSAIFSRHGKWLASASSNGLVRIWEPGSMRLKHTLGHGYGVYCLAVSKDSGMLAASGGYGHVQVWDMTGDAPKSKGMHKVSSTPLLSVALAPDGKTFATGGSDARVYLWDLTTNPPKEANGGSGHTGNIHAVVYAPSGHVIASGGADKTIRLWSLADGNKMKAKTHIETPAGVLCLAYHPREDKTLISGGTDGVIRVWEVGTKLTQKSELKTKYGAVNAIAFSTSGKTIAAAFADGTAHTWAFGTKLIEKASLEGHKAAATCVAFSPDGTLIATGSADWTVRTWPGVSGIKPRDKTIAKGHLSHVYTVAFNPDGAGLASGSYDATVRLWELAAAEPKERVSKLKEEGAIYTLAYAPDGKTLAAGGATAIFRTCDADGHFLFGFIGHTGQISRLAWSPDGKHVASCSNDKTVRIWDGPAGKGLNAITAFQTPVHTVAFSPDGKQLACASGAYLTDKLGQIIVKDGDYLYNDSTVRIYDTSNFEERARLKYDKTMMTSIAYAPDGLTLYLGGVAPLLRRWDTAKLPKEAETFYKWSAGGIGALACSPDGRWLAAYGPDYHIHVIERATGTKVHDWVMGEQFGNLAFAPDSRHIAISVATGVVLVLRVEKAGPSALR